MRIEYQFPSFIVLFLTAISLLLMGANEPDESPQAQSPLQQLQSYIGEWRGVGKLRADSSQDWWKEKAEWKWSFADDETAIVFEATDARYFQTGKLLPGENVGEYSLVVTTVDDKQFELHGQLDEEGVLTFKANEPPDDYTGPTSVSFRQFAKGDRLVVQLFKSTSTGRMIPIGSIGYTKIGSNFGKKGIPDVECVVTGGKGTIPVTYMGETYYVCCGGCRDHFNEDPKLALEQYNARKAKEKEVSSK